MYTFMHIYIHIYAHFYVSLFLSLCTPYSIIFTLMKLLDAQDYEKYGNIGAWRKQGAKGGAVEANFSTDDDLEDDYDEEQDLDAMIRKEAREIGTDPRGWGWRKKKLVMKTPGESKRKQQQKPFFFLFCFLQQQTLCHVCQQHTIGRDMGSFVVHTRTYLYGIHVVCTGEQVMDLSEMLDDEDQTLAHDPKRQKPKSKKRKKKRQKKSKGTDKSQGKAGKEKEEKEILLPIDAEDSEEEDQAHENMLKMLEEVFFHLFTSFLLFFVLVFACIISFLVIHCFDPLGYQI